MIERKHQSCVLSTSLLNRTLTRDPISKSIDDPILGKTLRSLIVVLNWDSLGVLSFVTTLMSCSVSSNEFIALHSNLSYVTDHWGIS